MAKATAKKSRVKKEERWTLTGIPKTVQAAVKKAAKAQGVSVSEFVEKALKGIKNVRKTKIQSSKIKSINDAARALTQLEKRLQAVEHAKGYVHLKRSTVGMIAEKTHLKELYDKVDIRDMVAKGNSMVHKAYQYAKDKCVGKPKRKAKRKKK